MRTHGVEISHHWNGTYRKAWSMSASTMAEAVAIAQLTYGYVVVLSDDGTKAVLLRPMVDGGHLYVGCLRLRRNLTVPEYVGRHRSLMPQL